MGYSSNNMQGGQAWLDAAWLRCKVYVAGLMLFCLFSTVVHGEGLDPRMIQGIYGGAVLSDVDRKGLEHLQVGLRKLYGVELALLASRQEMDGDKPVIILGRKAALETGRLTAGKLQKAAPGGHVIVVDDKGVVIAGVNSWDTRYGVYSFLEKLGVRFFMPRFEQAAYPKKVQKVIPWFSVTDKPDFAYRNGRSDVWRQMYYQLGDPRKGMDPELFDTEETGSDLWIDHSAGYLVPKLLYYEKHPEYYAMQGDGRRIEADRFTDHRTPLCLSNPDVTGVSARRALGWVEREPDKNFFMITYGDTGVWCQCDKCKKLDSWAGAHSDRLLSWVNPIAKEVGKKFPDKILMTFAFGGTDDPPQKHVPEDNVWMVGSTGLGNVPFWDHALQKGKLPQKNIKKIDGWLKVVPDRYTVCEYQSNTYKPALIDSMVARLRYYKKKGVRGIVFTYGVPRNFKTLWHYLMSRLMWDMEQDPEQLASEFVEFYYGPAGGMIREILTLSQKRYSETLNNGSGMDGFYPTGFYSVEFTDQVVDAFTRAEKALEDDPELLAKVQAEERFFIEDWMRHPAYSELDDDAKKVVLRQLDRLQRLAGDTEKELNDLARKVHKLALAVESSYPGTLEIVEEWIGRQKLFVSNFEKLEDGVRLPPQSFMFAGFGPARYGQNCPPRDAAGIYVKGNSKHRSHRMVAEFELETLEAGKDAALTLSGQASMIFIFKPTISIRLNGNEIYKGTADFVKNNWSLQSYPIKNEFLRIGANRLEVINTSLPASIVRWNQGWVLIADTVIRFE